MKPSPVTLNNTYEPLWLLFCLLMWAGFMMLLAAVWYSRIEYRGYFLMIFAGMSAGVAHHCCRSAIRTYYNLYLIFCHWRWHKRGLYEHI